MKSTADDAAAFRAECLKWQDKLGLSDWALVFKTENAGTRDIEAMCDYDCETRVATLTYYLGIDDAEHPKDNAKHEMLHLAMADVLFVAIQVFDESHPWLVREEHRVIERLMKVIK